MIIFMFSKYLEAVVVECVIISVCFVITCTPAPAPGAGDGRRGRLGRRWWTPPSLPSAIDRPAGSWAEPEQPVDDGCYAHSNRLDSLDADADSILATVEYGMWGPWAPLRSKGTPQQGNPPPQPRGPVRYEPRCLKRPPQTPDSSSNRRTNLTTREYSRCCCSSWYRRCCCWLYCYRFESLTN